MMEGLGDLFSNKLFLQYLSQAGQSIAEGEGAAPGLNQVTQQNIQSQNFMDMLKQFLDKSDSSMKVDKSGMHINLPSENVFQADPSLTLPNQGADTFQTNPSLTGTGSIPNMNSSSTASSNVSGGVQPMANPFGQTPASPSGGLDLSGIDASMLAGLSPEHITAALGLKMQQDEVGRQSVKDVQDMMYKQALTAQANAATLKAQRGDALDQPHPIPGLGGQTLTLRQWNSLPTSEQEYRIYVDGARKLGDGEIMSKREWDLEKPTDREKLLRAVGADPELLATHKMLADKTERAPTIIELALEAVEDPEGFAFQALELIGKVNAGTLTPNEKMKQETTAASIDLTLRKHSEDKEFFGLVETYNNIVPDNSTSYYSIKSPMLWYDKAVKKDLPIVKGKQLTMGDVRNNAKESGITVQESLKLLDEKKYETPDDVKAAFDADEISWDEGRRILIEDFGYEED